MKGYNAAALEKKVIITIDGPAGSGKSTVAAELADKLGIAYLDTGAMYRAVTLAALERNIAMNVKSALIEMVQSCRIKMVYEEGVNRIWVDGWEATGAIRSPDVTDVAHKLASIAEIREILVDRQRQIGQEAGSLVSEGRDQGTVVFPEADFKFYLDAGAECRAQRRFNQLQEQGVHIRYKDILESQQERDQRDTTRVVGPLKKAEDAIVIDTTDMTLEEVVDKLYSMVMGGAGPNV
ncbi:MAG: (d)CMP kinase [Sedimentisphaerales bacterium]|nr:(d)CMP kinase [Sedimentisphaerales bacterium]